MQKRGQAAMEFLMTYGWAILAAIIAIGVLAYFGVFSPGKYTPDATVVNPPFYAAGATIAAGQIQVELRNNGGEDVNVTTVTLTGCADTPVSFNTVVAPSASSVFSLTCSPTLAGDTFSGDITIKYLKGTSQLELTSTGTVAGKITA